MAYILGLYKTYRESKSNNIEKMQFNLFRKTSSSTIPTVSSKSPHEGKEEGHGTVEANREEKGDNTEEEDEDKEQV